MSASAPATPTPAHRSRIRRAAAAAVVAAALAVAALTGPGQTVGDLTTGDRVAATLNRVTPVVVKPVGGTGTSIKAKGSSWALPATTTKRVTVTSQARGSSWA